MADESTNAVLHYPAASTRCPSALLPRALQRSTSAACCEDGSGHPRPGLRQHRGVCLRDHLHRRRRGHPALPRLPDRAARRELDLRRDQLPADLRRAADPGRARRVLQAAHPAHAAPRGHEALLRRLPARRPPDGDAVRRGQRAVDVLPGRARPFEPPSRSSCPSSGCWPRCRRSRRTPTRSRSASRSSTRTTRSVYCANFLHMMFAVPAEPYEVDPDVVQGAEPAADPARRPRAELLDLDGAAGRLVAGQPVRVDRGRHQRAVGPAARRRQPGGARDARGDPGATAATSTKFVEQAKDKEHGFRLMGFGHRVYKNFDPRAKIIKAAGRRGARRSSASTTRCSTSPSSSRRWR